MKQRSALRSYRIVLCLLIVLVLKPAAASDVQRVRELYRTINEGVASDSFDRCRLQSSDIEGFRSGQWSYVDTDDVYANSAFRATVYISKMGAVVMKVVIDVDSPSGDWSNSKELYFYDNGRVAFSYERHSTFQGYDYVNDVELPDGPYLVETRLYFDPTGKLVREIEEASIVPSKKKIPAQFVRTVEIGKYESVNELPFHHLIQSCRSRKLRR